ncbi:YceD family protein [Xiamenia xianingshaonis]|uniref:DUF177 domain-containing protein n=1 Tax=Xiamenia xianingshaonis TaxID=2682776 RepID=A0A9E6MSP7_9ACTN|nr:DUF177 domain-containing protein [Xiamenia xianingshaonis]NHM14560.1 DUF177 domain-containing protein [Xiamenia xianingshaonis]QTU84991.1 DUF177 domain-containing protein [Xiamenia xianingshaonis]
MGKLTLTVPYALLTPAATESYEGTYDLPVFKAGPDLYEFKEPLAWTAVLTNTGDAILVTGTVEGEASTACARCLSPVALPVTGDIEGYYLLGGEDEAPEDLDEDEFEVLPADKVIDLESLIRAALLVEMPLVPLCRDDCAGLCPRCGHDLNDGPCDCKPEPPEDLDANNPFAALKNLKFDE